MSTTHVPSPPQPQSQYAHEQNGQQTAHEEYSAERDALIPKPGYVIIPANDELDRAEQYLKIHRLNMRRTLRLSQWLDSVGSRPTVQQSIQGLVGAMTEEVDTGEVDENGNPIFATRDLGGAQSFQMILTINKFISSLALEEALELFSIITAKDYEWLDENWEPGWGIQAIRVAFQQQGFANVFAGASNQTDVASGETAVGKPVDGVPSQAQSISSSPNMAGQTT